MTCSPHPQEAAKLLRVKQTTLEQWRAKRIGPTHIKLGSGTRSPVRYRRADVEEFLRNNTIEAEEAK